MAQYFSCFQAYALQWRFFFGVEIICFAVFCCRMVLFLFRSSAHGIHFFCLFCCLVAPVPVGHLSLCLFCLCKNILSLLIFKMNALFFWGMIRFFYKYMAKWKDSFA